MLSKIVGAIILGSSLAFLPSCKKKSKEEDPRYIQRVQALEQVVNQYETSKTEFNEAEGKEAMINCLTDVKNMLEFFVQSYTASEKEYAQFVGIISKYGESSAAEVSSTRYSDIGALRRAQCFMSTVTEYMPQFEQHKKPLEQIELVRKIVLLQEKPESMLKVCSDASSKCYELFEAVEKTIKSDISYLDRTIEYAGKNKGKESELICRLAKISKEKRESVQGKAGYYKSTFKQHKDILQKYFPNKPEEKSQSF